MNITQTYYESLERELATGKATEHSYRPALKAYIEGFNDKIIALNEAARTKVGAPDLTLKRKRRGEHFDIGHLEAKQPGADLDAVEKSDQLKRYRGEFENLILTDHLEFRFYRDGKKVETVSIGSVTPGGLVRYPQRFNGLEDLLKNFLDYEGQQITNAKRLARMMARKARLMRSTFREALKDNNRDDFPELTAQLAAFRKILIHDLSDEDFADVYAQTIAYGLFTARVHDETLDDFSRGEARELIPKSNPFLRNLFDYICGPNIEEGIVWTVDQLCEIFLLTNPNAILQDFGRRTGRYDPMVHFYEEFLTEYDPKLRKSRGVWYTPEPVVNFIVRAIDEVLKTHFDLPKGLADTSKVTIKKRVAVSGKAKQDFEDEKVHKVQLLDVATGTGTFTAEAIRQIAERFKGQEGIWSQYVERDLLPRIHGFEILMASYAMCHLKVDLLLKELGYKPSDSKHPPRLSVYLTNSLEEDHPDADGLFAHWLSNEANEASRVKRDLPIMVAYGNPPYSGESQNKGAHIMGLMDSYKKEPGGKEKLKERNPKWLNDDYVKFMRMAEHFIEKNGSGILAYITNHGYLDNPTFRGMRWHLLKTFDDIYVLDLHGNAKKKEVAPDGSADKNVFDIQQGVAIIIAVKHGKNKDKLAQVYHQNVWGARQTKYEHLLNEKLNSRSFKKLKNKAPQYLFIPKDYKLVAEYERGFSIKALFPTNGVGMVTAHDSFVMGTPDELEHRFLEFKNSEPNENVLHEKFDVRKKKGWEILKGHIALQKEQYLDCYIKPLTYRPFDKTYIFYEPNLVWRTVEKIMQHFLAGENLGLQVGRQGQVVGNMQWNLVYVSENIIDFNTFYRGGVLTHPLYLYAEDGTRSVNMDGDIRAKIEQAVMGQTTPVPGQAKRSAGTSGGSVQSQEAPGRARGLEKDKRPDELDIFDYIYAVLHSPKYRERYKEFLKSDFPRVPYPDPESFWPLVALGREIRLYHLMEHKESDDLITTFPRAGDGFLDKISYDESKSRVWINKDQYFGDVPANAWNFYIGGYQPAQKWLKDRKKAGRRLDPDDIIHWQKIIKAQSETIRLMGEIDKEIKL